MKLKNVSIIAAPVFFALIAAAFACKERNSAFSNVANAQVESNLENIQLAEFLSCKPANVAGQAGSRLELVLFVTPNSGAVQRNTSVLLITPAGQRHTIINPKVDRTDAQKPKFLLPNVLSPEPEATPLVWTVDDNAGTLGSGGESLPLVCVSMLDGR